MIPIEIIGLTVIGCSAFYIPALMGALRRERKIVKAAEALLAGERNQFFEAIQEKAAENATILCRTCSACKRVVHRYRPVPEGVICHECDVEGKKLR